MSHTFCTVSVTIDSFEAVNDGGVPRLYIKTSTRNIKVQCFEDSAFADWSESLRYLLVETPPRRPWYNKLNHLDDDSPNMLRNTSYLRACRLDENHHSHRHPLRDLRTISSSLTTASTIPPDSISSAASATLAIASSIPANSQQYTSTN